MNEVLMEGGIERAHKNGRRFSSFAVCQTCLRGHRQQCEHPVTCACVCQRITVVLHDEVAVLNARWESKLAKYVAEIERDASDRAMVTVAEKAMAAVA